MLGASIKSAVDDEIESYAGSKLEELVVGTGEEPMAIKFVSSRWAHHYANKRPLKVSETPALTWGTGTYVTPLAFPLSSVLYGRIGLVSTFKPAGWRVFNATQPSARTAYVNWARAQASFEDLVLTVHSNFTNHKLRDKFRKDFGIDCVLFHPDQEAELHTDRSRHAWMLVTDWTDEKTKTDIATGMSTRLAAARFTVLVDEEFDLLDGGLPIQTSKRMIEATTTTMLANSQKMPVSLARSDPLLGGTIAATYGANGYLHLHIEP